MSRYTRNAWSEVFNSTRGYSIRNVRSAVFNSKYRNSECIQVVISLHNESAKRFSFSILRGCSICICPNVIQQESHSFTEFITNSHAFFVNNDQMMSCLTIRNEKHVFFTKLNDKKHLNSQFIMHCETL